MERMGERAHGRRKGDGLASLPRRYRVPGQPLLNRHQVGGVSRSPDGLFAQHEREPIRGRPAVRGKRTYGGRPGQRVEEQGTRASRTQKHSEAGYGRPVDRGVWTANTVKRPRQQPAHPQYANYWAPLMCKRRTLPHSAQPQHTNHWAPQTRKRHQQEHRPQRPTESSDPTQHAKGTTGACPGPRKETTTRRNVTQGGGGGGLNRHQVGGVSRSPDGLSAQQEWEPIRGRPTVRGKRTYGGRPGQRVEEQGTWAAQKHSEAGNGRPVDRGVWTAKTVKRPRQQPAHPQYANYWAPLTRKRHTMPHSAQSQHTNHWAPRTRKRHQQEHRPQRPTESSDPTQHAKGRTGDCPGPRKGATTRRNVTQGGWAGLAASFRSRPSNWIFMGVGDVGQQFRRDPLRCVLHDNTCMSVSFVHGFHREEGKGIHPPERNEPHNFFL